MEPALIKRAFEIVASTDLEDPCGVAINLNSLLGCVMDMWESAARSAEPYQDVLASLENAIREDVDVGRFTSGHRSAVLEALNYLTQSHLVAANAHVVRERFVREGIGPLSFARRSEDDGGPDV